MLGQQKCGVMHLSLSVYFFVILVIVMVIIVDVIVIGAMPITFTVIVASSLTVSQDDKCNESPTHSLTKATR